MVFSSPTFLFIFLPIVFIGSLLCRRSVKAGNVLLLIASLVFYAWGEPMYVLLMMLTTFVNYLCALLMEKVPGKKRLWCVLAVVWSIGTLVLYKYTDMLVASFNGLTGLSIPLPGIALPVGISFFTFQALSYVLDVYRGEANINRSYFQVLLYISLFPQLIAGPIVKYHDVDAQIKDRSASLEDVAEGFKRFCFGLGKKVLLANTLAITADRIYALEAAQLNAPIAWLGAVAYLFQIYFDFSGYSDMAIGLGRAFGFTFKENFNYPYIANSMQDFWRRWHISLSTWFKEYVYIPLGGNRKGKFRTGLNKMIVFLLTGLWHGASWNFALWGLFHGGFLMLESYGAVKPNKWPKVLQHVYTVLAVCLGFVLFRAETLAQTGLMFANMFAGWQFTPLHMAVASSLVSPLVWILLPAAVVAATPLFHNVGQRLEAKRLYWPGYLAAAVLLVVCVLYLSTAAYNPFIYFRF